MLLGLAALAAGLLTGCQRPDPPLRVGVNLWPPGELLYLAHERGFFAEEGLDLRLVEFTSLSDSRRAFSQGKLDGFAATIIDVMTVRDLAARDARVVRVMNVSEGADLIIARTDLGEVTALRGARVGVEPASLGLYLLARALERHGLALADVTLVAMDQSLMVEGLHNRLVEAVVIHPPEYLRLHGDPNYHALFTSADIPGEIVDVYAFDAAVIARRPEAMAAFHRGLDRAFDYYRAEPGAALAIMARRHQLDPEEFARSLHEGIVLVAPEQQAAAVASASTLATTIDHVARVLHQQAIISDPVRAADCLPPP
jgi:NitT/TauT family transport system substrate-binding protein